MKISMFWDITPCGPLKVSHRFGTTHHLKLQTRKIRQARNQHEAGSRLSEGSKLVPCLAYSSTLKMEAIFLRDIGSLSTDYTVLYPRREKSSYIHPTDASFTFGCCHWN
jgi:hypothetical protein